MAGLVCYIEGNPITFQPGLYELRRGDEPSQWNYWKRELLIYQSGWLDGLPEGICAPHCYDAVEMPGNIAGMWLEDIKDTYAGSWPLHRYALAARHLGRLNGIYISRRELPSFPWLSKQRTRQWLDLSPGRISPGITRRCGNSSLTQS